jgi:excisionase family DNA binding protein
MRNEEKKFFTTGDVSKVCGASKVTVLRWIHTDKLIAFQLPGGQNRIKREDFISFLDNNKIPWPDYLKR